MHPYFPIFSEPLVAIGLRAIENYRIDVKALGTGCLDFQTDRVSLKKGCKPQK